MPSHTASPDGSTIQSGSGGVIFDLAGNAWTISAQLRVLENGKFAGFTANVEEIAWIGNNIWHENTSSQWYKWTGTGWLAGPNPLPPPDFQSLTDLVEQILANVIEIRGDLKAKSARIVVPTTRNLTTKEPMKMATSIIDDAITVLPLQFFNVDGVSGCLELGRHGNLGLPQCSRRLMVRPGISPTPSLRRAARRSRQTCCRS